MSLKSKVSISMCLLLTVSICIYAQVPSVHSWGWGTHRFIASNAIGLMPDNMSWFFSKYSSTIVSYSIMPDVWRSSDPNEGNRHGYYVDRPHGESDYADGVLPWAVEDNFNTLVQYLRENDWDHAAQLAGVISHYIADGSQPLHATSNSDPIGNHGPFESTVDSKLGEVNMDMPGFEPYKLENIFSSTMQMLEESFSFTKEGSNGGVNLTDFLDNDIKWNDWIKSMTENRLRTGAQLLANIWYTAFVRAGISSPPPSPLPAAATTNYTPYIVGGVLAITVISILLVLYIRRR